MATFFGEVVQQSSRAFWDGCDDSDEDVITNKGPVYQLKRVGNSQIDQYDLMIFSADRICTEFASLCFLPDKSKIVATIEEVKENIVESGSVKLHKLAAELYTINSKILLLMCTSDISLLTANELLQLVTPWLDKSKEAIILTANPVQEYKSFIPEQVPQSSFVRSLKTKAYKGDNSLCARLECPNALTGFSAAVLSWCQVKDKPCVLYVYYYATSLSISNTIGVEPLFKLIEKLLWYKQFQIDNKKEISDVKSIKIHNHVFENSNLYL